MSIFGKILYLPYKSGAIVFIGVLVVFTLFEGLLHILEVECNKRGLKGLIKKLYREFMIMGFISFAILLATELSTFTADKWYDAFHFAHIVIFFIGIVFMIQSGMLVSLVSSRRKTLVSHDSMSSETLIVEYVVLHTNSGIMKKVFDMGPISIPIPELREKIEYKIIQEFFIRNYNLPPEFKFANYMCRVLRDYVLSLVEVRPISWIVLGMFVALNIIRITAIDPIFAGAVCERYPAKNLHRGSSGAHRMLFDLLAGDPSGDDGHHYDDHHDPYGEHVCQEYLLRYTLMVLFFIVLYLIGVLTASEIYIQRLIDKVLDQEETIEWLEDEEQRMFQMHAEQTGEGGFYDINDLNDDQPPKEPLNPASSSALASVGAEEEEKTDLDGDHHPTRQPQQQQPPSHPPALGPRRLSAAYRRPSLRARGGSADEYDTDNLPPPPVHGAAAVRRLSMNHRMGSAQGNDMAAMMALGQAHNNNANASNSNNATSGTTGGASGAASGAGTSGRRVLTAQSRGMSMRGEAAGAALRTLGVHSGSQKHANNDPSLANNEDKDHPQSGLVNTRRLVMAHRMGSLRSDASLQESDSAAILAGLNNNNNYHGGSTGGGSSAPAVRRLMSHHRMGSLNSQQSEKSDPISGKYSSGNRMKVVSGSHNRRFLYLRCLERIMHQEFDFHANEARRVGQTESHSGSGILEKGGKDMDEKNIDRSYSHAHAHSLHHGGGSIQQMLHSPNTARGGAISRTHSVASMDDSGAPAGWEAGPESLVHGDMRSNFQLMQSLRREMLLEQQQEAEAVAIAPGAAKHMSLFNRKRSFLTSGSAKEASYTPANTIERKGSSTDLAGTVEMTEHGQSAPRHPERTAKRAPSPIPAPESGLETKPEMEHISAAPVLPTVQLAAAVPVLVPTVSSYGVPMAESSLRRGKSVEECYAESHTPVDRSPNPHTYRHFEHDDEHDQDHDIDDDAAHHRDSNSSTKRARTFSLAFESPPLARRPTSASQQGKHKMRPSMWSVVYAGVKSFFSRAVSALLGHHLGEAIAHVDADLADLQKDFANIFLWSNAELYYFTVEFALLTQCVYLALWATNFVFIARDSYYPVLWNIALVVPIPLNFLLTKQIIFTSVMLKSIVTLDKKVADQICEDAVDERNVRHRVRKVIRTALRTMEIPKENWPLYTQDQFELFVADYDIGVNEAGLKLFLHSIQIFLTDITVQKIFSVLDIDQDGLVEWENLSPIVFPELVKKQVKINRSKNQTSLEDSQKRSKSANYDYQIQGDLSTNKVKKEKEREKRMHRRKSLTESANSSNSNANAARAVSDSSLCVSENGASSKQTRRSTRFEEEAEEETRTPGRSSPLRHGSHHNMSGKSHGAEEGEYFSSDGSERGHISSESSFNSHSLDSAESSDLDGGNLVADGDNWEKAIDEDNNSNSQRIVHLGDLPPGQSASAHASSSPSSGLASPASASNQTQSLGRGSVNMIDI